MRVWTENSLYTFDRDTETITRTTLGDELRRDDEPIRCVAVVLIAVGYPATFVLDLAGDGVYTFRETSTVVAIDTEE